MFKSKKKQTLFCLLIRLRLRLKGLKAKVHSNKEKCLYLHSLMSFQLSIHFLLPQKAKFWRIILGTNCEELAESALF